MDGTDLRTLNPTWLRSHIGAVNQEPVLFSGTIRENILYGVNTGTEINEDDFERVVREAHVDEFVKQLPNGLETMVGQRGMMLSGGQKQRVAIARALIRVSFLSGFILQSRCRNTGFSNSFPSNRIHRFSY